jgi:hypothetical protein
MVTFPGWTDTKAMEWFDNTYEPIINLSNIIWSVFNIVSTIITIVGIYKILHTLHQLKKYNPHLKTNYLQLTLHALVLTLNLIPVVILSLPIEFLTSR